MQNIPTINLIAAQRLIKSGLELADEQDLQLSLAVVDAAGHLLAFARMDQAALVTIDVAIGKARTAAYLKAPSRLFEEFVNSGQPSMITVPNILPLQGGVPILYGQEVIGAVGVSGSSGDNDHALATTIAGSWGAPSE